MTIERAKRLAKQWANGYVCSLREGEAEEYHKLCFSALRAQQEKPFGGWISVEDELPERFQPVIICREKKRGEYIVEQGMRDVKDWWKVYGTRTKNVLFWMPMPWPPKEV